MSLDRLSIRSDWPDELLAMFPRITQGKLDAFAALITADRLVEDDGEPTPELLAWVEGVQP